MNAEKSKDATLQKQAEAARDKPREGSGKLSQPFGARAPRSTCVAHGYFLLLALSI